MSTNAQNATATQPIIDPAVIAQALTGWQQPVAMPAVMTPQQQQEKFLQFLIPAAASLIPTLFKSAAPVNANAAPVSAEQQEKFLQFLIPAAASLIPTLFKSGAPSFEHMSQPTAAAVSAPANAAADPKFWGQVIGGLASGILPALSSIVGGQKGLGDDTQAQGKFWGALVGGIASAVLPGIVSAVQGR